MSILTKKGFKKLGKSLLRNIKKIILFSSAHIFLENLFRISIILQQGVNETFVRMSDFELYGSFVNKCFLFLIFQIQYASLHFYSTNTI